MPEETCVTQSELTEAIRAAIQDRAIWFYLLIQEFKEAGYETDAPVKKAIFKFGRVKGKRIGTATTPKEFFEGIGTPTARLAFSMEDKGVTDLEGVYRFHH
jgi:hypothetical protein